MFVGKCNFISSLFLLIPISLCDAFFEDFLSGMSRAIEDTNAKYSKLQRDPGFGFGPSRKHHIAHFCPNLEVARQCIRKCMKEGKPAFCGKDHVCYCGHTYDKRNKKDKINVKAVHNAFYDLYEKYFGPQYAELDPKQKKQKLKHEKVEKVKSSDELDEHSEEPDETSKKNEDPTASEEVKESQPDNEDNGSTQRQDSPEDDKPGDQTPADETPANETPANETPANETPANETPANETPANETPANETPANETPANETPANETLADETPDEVISEPTSI